MTNTYALYVEPDVPETVRTSLGDLLMSDERIDGWWNHLPNLYLITSENGVADISKLIGTMVKPWSFLVIKVDPAESQGWLPDRAWPWIQKQYA